MSFFQKSINIKTKASNLIIDFINLPLYLLSLLIPKNKNVWIFGAWFGEKFADNSKYLYEYISKNHKNINAIWLTRNKNLLMKLKKEGKKVYLTYSLKGYYYSAIAGKCIVSTGIYDVNRFVSSTRNKIQLWHGTPLKFILNDTKDFQNKFKSIKDSLLIFNKIKYKILISTSEVVSKNFKTAFDNVDNIYITGYPRTDILKLSDCKNIISYLPTHRTSGRIDIIDFFSAFNFEKFEDILRENGYTLICKLHFYDLKKIEKLKLKKSNYIKFISDELDVYELLTQSNILITDYSSIFFDFLLTERPLIFTPFDFEEYMLHERGMYYNYFDITPGPKCNCWDEVLMELAKIIKGNDEYKEERKEINNMFNYYKDFKNSERVYNLIESIK